MFSLPITLFSQQSQENVFANYKQYIQPQIQNCEKGLSTFLNLDCTPAVKKLSDFSLSEAHPIYDCELFLDLNPIDLIFLNNFRVFLYTSNSKKKGRIGLTRLLYFPSLNFSIQMIQQPFKLVSTPLTHILTKKNPCNSGKNSSANSFITTSNSSGRNKKTSIKFGFLTLDQNHRMCPLMASDPMALQVPLIGVWIFGINYPKSGENEIKITSENYLIWGILAEFVKNQNLFEKYAYDERRKNFFLACFSTEENPKFYEVELLKGDNKWSLLKVKEDVDLEDDYKDLCFERNVNTEIHDIDKILKGDFFENNESDEIFNKDDSCEEAFEKSYDKTSEIMKKPLFIEDLIGNQNEINPREMPKKEEFINYLSPRLGFEISDLNKKNNQLNKNLLPELKSPLSFDGEHSRRDDLQSNFSNNQWNPQKIFEEQAKQLKFLQDQVLSLQEALKKTQEITKNPQINDSKPIPQQLSRSKMLINQATNTTFYPDKDKTQCEVVQAIERLNSNFSKNLDLNSEKSIQIENKAIGVSLETLVMEESINYQTSCQSIFTNNNEEKNEKNEENLKEILNNDKENCGKNSNISNFSEVVKSPLKKKNEKKKEKPNYFMQMDFLNSLKKKSFCEEKEVENCSKYLKTQDNLKSSVTIPQIKFEQTNLATDSSEDVNFFIIFQN